MKAQLCSRCRKRVAVVFITKIENGKTINEGLCLQCARDYGIKPVEDLMKKMGITEEDMDSLSADMMAAFNGAEEMEDSGGDDEDNSEEEEGKTATFPFLNRLFGAPSGGSDGDRSSGSGAGSGSSAGPSGNCRSRTARYSSPSGPSR